MNRDIKKKYEEFAMFPNLNGVDIKLFSNKPPTKENIEILIIQLNHILESGIYEKVLGEKSWITTKR